MAGLGWGRGVGGRAARVWAGGLVLAFVTVGAGRRDKEAMAFAVVAIVAAALTLVRGGLLGRIGLALVALDTIGWMGPAALANARGGEQVADVAVPAVLAVLGLAVLLLVLGTSPAPVLGIALVLLVGSVGGSVATSGDGDGERADARMVAQNVAFSPQEVTVPEGGTIAAENLDLFWHTLTIPDLDIDARIATGASRFIRLDAPPGTYRFVCAIPGHESAGMTGTITVV